MQSSIFTSSINDELNSNSLEGYQVLKLAIQLPRVDNPVSARGGLTNPVNGFKSEAWETKKLAHLGLAILESKEDFEPIFF